MQARAAPRRTALAIVRASMKIIHVDDEADWRELVGLALAGQPRVSAVLQFADGRSAVDAIAVAGAEPDLVLTDFHLRGATGLQVLRELRARACGAPVAVLATALSEADRARCLHEGAIAVIDKAMRLDALARALAALLARVHAGAQAAGGENELKQSLTAMAPSIGSNAGLSERQGFH